MTFHPTTWWAVGLALAIASSATTNVSVLLEFCVISIALSFIFRSKQQRVSSLRFYLAFAGLILLTRLAFRVIFNSNPTAEDTFLRLPTYRLSLGFGEGITLLGNVSLSTIQAGLTDGLRLAAIILAFAMSATLSSPRNLIKSLPNALYELGAAVAIALNLAPQLISSIWRVRRARSIRGRSSKNSQLLSIVIPVLEDAFDKSMSLAASMDARGFGRRDSVSAQKALQSKFFGVLTLLLTIFGVIFLLLAVAPYFVALICFALAVLCATLSIRHNSSFNRRTHFRKLNRTTLDFATLAASLILGIVSLVGVWR